MRSARISKGFKRFAIASSLVVALVATLTVGGATPEAANAAAVKSTVGWLKTSDNKIVTASGKTHIIKAISWFGMETSNCAPHGLWTISLEEGLKTIADQGFNTIRLPYANQCIDGAPIQGVDFYKNPQLKGKTSLQVMDYVIQRAGSYGLSVILDRHRPDYNAQSEYWYTDQYSESLWIKDWAMLATRYKNNSTVIGADLHNEPRGNVCWGCGDPKRDWKLAATKAGDAIHAINPNLLIVVEGIERSKDGTNSWWGGNMKDYGSNLLKLKVANRVVYSPHDYPSTIYNQSWFSDKNYPNNLPAVWDANWGYLQSKGVPVLLGEFGTKLETTSDEQWLSTLVKYLQSRGMSFAYWSFNPNSGDTGGILKDDWKTLQTAKLTALKPILNPTSSVTPSVPVPTPTPTPKPTIPAPTPTPTKPPMVTPSPTPTPTKPPVSTPTPTPSTGSLTAQYILQNKWGQGYVVDLVLKADKSGSPKDWSVSWKDPKAVKVSGSWGSLCNVASGVVTCKADGYGKDNFQWSNEVRVGVQIESSDGGSAPSNPTLTLK